MLLSIYKSPKRHLKATHLYQKMMAKYKEVLVGSLHIERQREPLLKCKRTWRALLPISIQFIKETARSGNSAVITFLFIRVAQL